MTNTAAAGGRGFSALMISPFVTVRKHRFLIAQLIKRNWAKRYKGTIIGILWLFLRPMLLLTAFVFIRGIIFSSRVAGEQIEGLSNNLNVAVFLFCGLIFFFFSSEIIQQAPSLILGRRGYVKRLVFPLETFAFVAIGAAVLQFAVIYVFLALTLLYGGVNFLWSSLMIFILFVPLVFLWCGILWLISSLAVYIRDLEQVAFLLSMLMLFLGPIFYRLDEVPTEYRGYMYINPLTFPITQIRRFVIEDRMLDWSGYAIYFLVGIVFFYLGYFVFNRLRRGFADVL